MDIEVVLQILPWIVPPVLGALIGYVTNYLAIKMLFRPLTEKRIFGIRIPLTPGIIPKQRHILAKSIGNMVSEKLLTFSAFKNHLDSPQVQSSLRTHISGLTDSLLDQELSFFQNEKIELFLHFIENFIFKTLMKLFHSDKVTDNIKKLIRNFISEFLQKDTCEVLKSIKLKQIIASYILPVITRSGIKTWLYQEISQWVKIHVQKNTPLEEIIPKDLVDGTLTGFEHFIPYFIDILFAWLREEGMKTTLEQQGRELIKNIFRKLNLFQQFFVSVGQYDKTLTEKIPEIVTDTLISLESAAKDPTNQKNFIASSRKAIDAWLKKGVFDILNNETLSIDGILKSILDKLFSLLEGPQAEEFILDHLEHYIQENKERTLKEFLSSRIGIDEEDIINQVQQYSLSLLSKNEVIEKISKALTNLVIASISGLENKSIRDILGLEKSTKEGIDNFLLEKLFSVIELKLPDLVAGLNIYELVVNKIDGLDVADVEKLLLMVIAQHLKWINVFGALLGAIIGLSQVFINLILK
ncbi:MAG: DUF445 family protein [Spirochaetales bacterium]|nr:DUF445 family protein [Spirochaetales bacterium]